MAKDNLGERRARARPLLGPANAKGMRFGCVLVASGIEGALLRLQVLH
jgi:hypothetical protein